MISSVSNIDCFCDFISLKLVLNVLIIDQKDKHFKKKSIECFLLESVKIRLFRDQLISDVYQRFLFCRKINVF